MIKGYILKQKNRPEEPRSEILQYAKQNELTLSGIIEDHGPEKSNWANREIYHEASRTEGPLEIIVYQASDIAVSTLKIMIALEYFIEQGITLHFVKYKIVLRPNKMAKLTELIKLVRHIESDYLACRTTQAIARRRAAGLPLGRPKGKKNKTLKLDKHAEEIRKYLSLKVSKASIAKLIGCHPQTLYQYLIKKGIGQGVLS